MRPRLVSLLAAGGLACTSTPDGGSDSGPGSDADTGSGPDASAARVEQVDVTGSAGSYTFSVTVRSPDTGCDRYADWWEVLTPGGELLYRRILTHSHVDEQPFTRSGGPVPAQGDDEVIVRVHMSPGGYADAGRRGTVGTGFSEASVGSLAPTLADVPPQPDGCRF